MGKSKNHGKGGKGKSIPVSDEKKAPQSKSMRAGLQVRNFILLDLVSCWKNSPLLKKYDQHKI